MNQKIEELSQDDAARVEAQRKWVRAHYPTEAQSQYETLEGKLRLLEIILSANWIAPGETVKLQSLGIALGDALVQRLGMRWAAVEDEHGRDPALILEGTSVVLFPLTIISKRIDRGEAINVRALFEGVCTKVQTLKGLV